MKRGALIAAIDAAPKVYGYTFMGPVAFEKGSLKEAIKAYFPSKADETFRAIDAAGLVIVDQATAPEGFTQSLRE